MTSLSRFTFMHWRRKWQPTLVFLPGESQGGGAWWAAVYGVAQSWTRLKQLSSSSSTCLFWPLWPIWGVKGEQAAPGKKTAGLQQKNAEVKTKKNKQKTPGNGDGGSISETPQPPCKKRTRVDPTVENQETFMCRAEVKDS